MKKIFPIKLSNKRFFEMDLELSFGKHTEEKDDFDSSSIKLRIEDLYNAFSDKKVKRLNYGKSK